MKNATIECPHCHQPIDVDQVLAHSAEERIRKELNAQYSGQQAELEKSLADIQKKQTLLNKQKQELEASAEEKVAELLRSEKKQLEVRLKKQLSDENADQLQAMQNELKAKSEQVKELNRTKAEIEKLKREKDELKELAEAEAAKKLNETLAIERAKIRQYEEEKNELKFKELQKQLADQVRLTEEMKRKQEQGSMQLQGEVQELAIEEYLTSNFPMDTILEIGKGVRGGDCIQVVNTQFSQNCGKIYYESKRTKTFANAWIEKFKQDMRNAGVDVGVLVTEAMPTDMPRMGFRDGVYICTFEEFKGLCHVLRQGIVQLSTVTAAQENKGTKMELLYAFLTGSEFRMQVEAIVDGFKQMKADLESEKDAMRRLWKKREKQLEKVSVNTLDMHGAIQGIAGKAVQDIQSLALEDELYLDN